MNNHHALSIQAGMQRMLSAFMILSLLLGAVGIPTRVVHAATVNVSLEPSADTWLRQSQATMNYGSMTIIQTSPNSGSRQNSLYLWDLSSVPAGSTITAASITFYVTDVSAYDFNLYQMRRNWVEGTNNGVAGTGASWTYSEAGTDAWATAGAMNTTTDRYNTDLWDASATTFNTLGSVTVPLNASGVAAVQSWLTTPASNFGLTMQYMGSGTTADYLYVAARDNASYAGATLNITYETAGPSITTTGTLNPFTSQPGVASATQTYTVSGSSLTGDINITAPMGFELSTDGSNYYSNLALPPSGGAVPSTTVYVRLYYGVEGTFNGNIAHTSSGATTKDVAVNGTVTAEGTITFAAFGDYGSNSSNEQAVATLVSGWNPDFIITTGDNSYGSTAIDDNIGKYYSNYIGNYVGSYGSGAATNNFYPSLGNHDYTDGGGSTAYFNYFTLPNNERYFDFVRGPVHFFVIDSNPSGTGSAPGDGRSPTSAQGAWLQAGLAASTSPWKIVYMHHPPFSSGSTHGSETVMQWPYEAWGATAVFSGHDHTYERVMRDDNSNGVNMPYFVTGAGGMSLYSFVTPVTGSAVRYSSAYGSMKVQATSSSITFEFWSVAGGGTLVDSYVINNSAPTITTSGTLVPFTSQPGVDSVEQSYSVAGSNLTGDLLITAPADFAISTTSGSGFGSTVTLAPSGGTVASTTIYVRFNRAAAGTSSGNITHASTGATTQNLAVSGTATTATCTPFTENFNSLTVGTRIGQVTGWTESGSASPAVVAAGLASTQGIGTGSSIFNWSAHPFLWTDAGLESVALQMDFQASGTGTFDDDRLAWMTENTPGSSQYNFGIQLDSDDDGTACASGQNIETYWRNPAFSTSTRIETTIACLPTLTNNGWYRAELIATKLTDTSAKLDVTLTALDASGNPGAVVASGSVPNTSTWAGGAAPAEYFSPSGTSTGLYPSYKNHTGTTGNGDNVLADFCSAAASQYTLTTNVTGNGSITLNPSGGVYDPGTVVQVTAVPGSGATFAGWSGNLTGSTNPASITMDGNKTVTAAFTTSSATLTFQEGVSSYAGTLDTTLKYNTPTNSYGSQAYFEWDTQETAGSNTPEIALLQFSNIFGSNAGQIPLGSTITSATLQYRVYSGTNSMGNSANVYEPLVTWNEATTYNTFGGDAGVQTDEYNSTLIDTADATNANTNYTVDVTASLQRWSSGTPNYGWVFLSSGTDGVEVHSSETTTATERPLLTVTYSTTPPTPPTAPTGMAATTPQPAQVHLVWTDTSNNETGFELERSTTGIGGTYSLLTTLASNTVAHNDTGLTGGQEYCYRVRAVNTAGQSSYAEPVCATPTAPEALDFGSGTAHVTFGDPAALDLAQFTIETWFKRTGAGTTNTTGASGIVSAIPLVTHGSSQDDGSNVDANWLLVIDDATDVIGADFEDMASGANHPVRGTTTISNNVWYHAAATYDGTTWRLYLNGRLEATLAANAAPRSDTIQQAGLGVMIESTGTTHGHFQGVLDEARVWNYARTQAEIRSSINSRIETAQTGLVARWALEDGGAVVAGSAGTTVNGTISGTGYSWVAPGAPYNLSFNEAPSQPVLVAPLHNAAGVGTSPTLTVAVSDPESEPMDVTFYGRLAGGSAGENFTVIVLPDTQNYSSSYPATFTTQTQWIVNNQADLNIVYVVHEGDIVNDASVTSQWTNADAAMDLLDAANIPYGVVPGNHDEIGGTTNYNTYFGVSRFAGKSHYGGSYPEGDNQNNYTLFTASGNDFIVINLDYTSPAAGSLDWADALLKANSTRRGIVVSHDIILTGNPASFSTWGQSIYNALNDNPNLFLMLNGHTHGEGQRKDGNIQSLLADYQNYTNGGNGYLRIMEFSPANDTISVKTYSPTLDAYETDTNSQFTLTYDMDAGVPFTNLGTVSDVPSGNNASLPWSGLLNNTQYEWYAVVSDGAAQTTGATWNFTTMSANTAPAATDQTVNAAEDTAQGIVLTGSDAESNPLTFTVLTQPAHGSLTGTAPILTYIPAANYNGSDSFTFKVNDGTADSNIATVTIEVAPVNDAPVCVDVTLTTNEDVTGQIAPSCTDVENDLLTYAVLSQPASGSASVTGSALEYVPAANFNGADTFPYKANDGASDSNTATVTVTVNAVNDLPVAVADDYTTAEGTPLVVAAPGVLSNDSDVEGGLTALLVSTTTNGTLVLNANGSFTYTPDAYYYGTDTFTYKVNDGISDGNTVTVTIVITTVNNAPVLNLITAQVVGEESLLTFTATATDPDISDILIFTATDEPEGSAITTGGIFTWTPSEAQGPNDYTFEVCVSDGSLSDCQDVNVTVNEVNIAPFLGAIGGKLVNENVELTFTATATDADLPANTLTFNLNGAPAGATIHPNTGVFTWTPNEAQGPGSYEFDVIVSDGTTTNFETVGVTVNEVNVAPVAVAQTVSTTEDTALNITLSGTDADLPANPLTFAVVDGPGHGALNGAAPALTYTPSANFHGSDSFTFTVSDGSLVSAAATVTITVTSVNDVPLAVDDSGYATNEDSAVIVPVISSVLGNDTDADGDPLTALKVTDPDNGTVTLNADGSFTYTPDADFHGPDGFTYKANDGTADSNIATVAITVNPVNDAPVCTPVSLNTAEDGNGQTDPECYDADGDTLSYQIAAPPASGTASVSLDVLNYQPNLNFNGTDSFTYKASDGEGDSNTATVSVTVGAVNDVPLAMADAFITAEDTALTVAAPGVLSNDSDVDAGDTLSAVKVTDPAHGNLTFNANGSFTYTPAADYFGSDSFTYKASDGTADSNVVTVSIVVTPVNDAPAAGADTYSVAQNGVLTVPAPGVLGNDTDIESDPLTALKLSDPTSGTLTFNADGSFVYTPAVNFYGAVSFTYQANDGISDSAPATVNLTIVPDEYTLTVTSLHGTVTQSPAKATYHYGETVQLTAAPTAGWNFASWGGGAGGTSNPVSITIAGDTTVIANYSQIDYTLSVPIVGSGSVTKDPDQAVYHFGDTVQLTAAPDAGWQFSAWSGDVTGSTSPLIITIDGNKSVTATFIEATSTCTGILYVDKNSTASNPTGCGWAQAFRTLQSALAAAPANGTTIWVADGTYYPDEGAGQVNNARTSTFNLKSGVSVYGGFSGSETLLAQRNPALYVTILSGDIDQVTGNAGNSYHVVTGSDVTSLTLDGFTITDGNANESDNFGGGLSLEYGQPTLKNLIFTNNSGGNGGGLSAFNSNFTLTDVLFSNNSVSIHGGGVFLQGSTSTLLKVTFTSNVSAGYGGGLASFSSSPVLTDVIFDQNQTTGVTMPGGGMYVSDGAPVLNRVTFSNNQALNAGGGGIYIFGSDMQITNVTFANNYANRRGGAIVNEEASPVLTNVTFSGNRAELQVSGAIANFADSDPVIRNSILWGDIPQEVLNADTTSVPEFVNSVIQGGCPSGSTCSNIVTTDPLLGTLANNGGFTRTMALGANSSAIDIGNNATCAAVDQRGVARPQGPACDAGAYEAGTQTTLTVSPVTAGYNGAATLTAALNYNGSGLVGKSISFTLNGASVGSALTNASGIATLNNVSVAGLNMGVYPNGITASFAGEEAYPASNGAADLTISKGTPVITWANPADIFQGTPLSAEQLNAAASVPGTFVYNPPVGTVLDAGNGQTLSVNFTPQDTVNYNNASASVTINVYTCHTLTVGHTGQGTNPAADPVQSSGCPAGKYRSGATVQLSGAAPATGWHIAGWVGTTDDASTAATNSLTMPASDHTVSVTYAQDEYTLDVVSAHGTVTKVPDQSTYHYLDEVTLSAAPQTGWIFTGWTPVLTDNKVTITANTTVTANYVPQTFTLTYAAGTGGTVTGDTPQTVNYGGSGSAVTAVANAGYHFVSWSDGVLAAARTDTNITANLSVTANFAVNTYTLTYTAGAGGTLTGNAAQTVNHGENGTTVTAVANTGYHFVNWSDGVLTAARTDTNVTANLSLTANFAVDTFTLTYTAGANGTLSGNAVQTVNHGADGTPITAVANNGYHFVSWSDGLTTNPRTETNVTANVSVSAQFAPDTITHSITLQSGWNLVSFNVHPTDTAVSAVLASLAGNYDLVYAWDASGAHAASGNWLRADTIPYSPDSLTALDETMGFWIHMTATDTLEVQGTAPASTDIPLLTGAGGWNLVSYPSSVNRAMPGALQDFGVGTNYSFIYAYHVDDLADPWKLFDRSAPAFANDLNELAPGWGYWVKVGADKAWTVNYTAP